MDKERIPERTIERLCLYRRILSQLESKGQESTSSQELGERTDITDSQIRKDLSLFGQFGVSGRGYKVSDLKNEIERILGKTRVWRVAIVGVGNLGSALLAYPGFEKEKFEIAVAFDNDLRKVGKMRTGVEIEDVRHLVEVIKAKKIDIGLITVPKEAAQSVADGLIEAGIESILNFAPCQLEVPEDVKVRNVDFCLGLEVLTQFLAAAKEKNKRC